MPTILIVEDEAKMRRLLELNLGEDGFDTRSAADAEAGLNLLQNEPVDLVLTDLKLPGMGGLEFLHAVKRANASLPVIVMTAFGSVETAVEAMKAGASDYVLKPFSLAEMRMVVHKELDVRRLRDENRSLREQLGKRYEYPNIVARSPKMQEVLATVERVAATNSTVLIGGESGVGKEVVANLIHKYSPRANRTFLKVNCAALPTDLLESELFGYEAGAFTGAAKAKPGKFDVCDKGTILLDEIGEMSPQLQAKLLHVLQDGTFSRLGSRLNSKVDVRVIAATNVDIEQAILDKRFREDLYYRLNAFILRVPPLRERTEEIPWLLENLAGKLAAANSLEPIHFSPRMMAAAIRYRWPGNLRELGNFVKRYLIMRDDTAALVELESKVVANPPSISAGSLGETHVIAPNGAGLKSAVRSTKDQTESRIIREILEEARWNRRIAAERLQISYKSLLQKIRYYNLEASV